jgi:hypothetical protein
MAAVAPRDPSDVKQPIIIWGNVIGILVFHLLALYGLVTLPMTQIRWQTYLWGEEYPPGYRVELTFPVSLITIYEAG